MKTTHLGTRIKASLYWATFCTGRAISSPFATTSDFNQVTCKACLKKMAANPLPAVCA